MSFVVVGRYTNNNQQFEAITSLCLETNGNLKLREHVASCEDRTPGTVRQRETVGTSVGASYIGVGEGEAHMLL